MAAGLSLVNGSVGICGLYTLGLLRNGRMTVPLISPTGWGGFALIRLKGSDHELW